MEGAPVITRFAPSPTGHLHVGGARTALFCWALARRAGGRFVLRIEDTDQQRSSESAAAGILEDLAWLGIRWDDGPAFEMRSGVVGGDERGVGPFYQAQRLDLYNEHIARLIESGDAYAAFETPEELEAKRREAIAAKIGYRYDRSALEIAPEERARRMAELDAAGDSEKGYVVRLKMPDEAITVHDLVLGDVTVGPEEFDDFIIRKRDGFPTYHLAVVVDDALMGVTHVLRGQEHLINTPRHIALQRAMGFDTPAYAHMPLIFNPDGSKMSKRDKDKALRGAVEAELLPLLAARLVLRSIFDSPDGFARLHRDAAFPSHVWCAREMASRLELADLGDPGLLDHLASMAISRPPAGIPSPADHVGRAAGAVIDRIRDRGVEGVRRRTAELAQNLVVWKREKKTQLDQWTVTELAQLVDLKLPEIDVDDFRRAGYLPGALCNFLALLGWNPKQKDADGRNVEHFDLDFLAANFDVAGIGKTNAKFDRAKLMSFNADAITALDDAAFVRAWMAWAGEYDPELVAALGPDRMALLAPAVKPRCKTLADGREVAAFALVGDDAFEYDGKAVHKAMLKGDAKGLELLRAFAGEVGSIQPWTPEAIDAAVEAFAARHDAGMGKVAQPIRVAVTGGAVSPPLGVTLAVLGADSVRARIERCVAFAEAAPASS